jgi:hypothetical protein
LTLLMLSSIWKHDLVEYPRGSLITGMLSMANLLRRHPLKSPKPSEKAESIEQGEPVENVEPVKKKKAKKQKKTNKKK